MGIDWNSLFDGAQKAVQQGLSDISKTAVPALEASVEQQGINWLQAQKTESQTALASGIKEISERPADPSGFGAAIKQAIQGPVLSTYGPWILGGIAVLIIGGMMLRKE